MFTVAPEIAFDSSTLIGIQVEPNPAPDAYIPKPIALAIPRSDSRFES